MSDRQMTQVDPTALEWYLTSVAHGSTPVPVDDVPWVLSATASSDASIQERLAPDLLERVRDLTDVEDADVGPGPGRGHDRRMGWRYWALGQAAMGIAGPVGDDAMRLADRFVGCRPCDPIAVAMMASGADALLGREPTSLEALTVLRRSAPLLHRPRPEPLWCWPEQELDPLDALLPHALMAAGDRLDEGALIRSGLQLLDWRLERNGQSSDPAQEFALSVVACARAATLTGDNRWTQRARALASAVSVEVSLRTSDLCAWQLAAQHLDALCVGALRHHGATSRPERSPAEPQLAARG